MDESTNVPSPTSQREVVQTWHGVLSQRAPGVARALGPCPDRGCEVDSFEDCVWRAAARSASWVQTRCTVYDGPDGFVWAYREEHVCGDDGLTSISIGLGDASPAVFEGLAALDGIESVLGGDALRLDVSPSTVLFASRDGGLGLFTTTPLSQLARKLDSIRRPPGHTGEFCSHQLRPTRYHRWGEPFFVAAAYAHSEGPEGETPHSVATCIPVPREGAASLTGVLSERWGEPVSREVDLFGVEVTADVFRDVWYLVDLRAVDTLPPTSQFLLFRTAGTGGELASLGVECEPD